MRAQDWILLAAVAGALLLLALELRATFGGGE